MDLKLKLLTAINEISDRDFEKLTKSFESTSDAHNESKKKSWAIPYRGRAHYRTTIQSMDVKDVQNPSNAAPTALKSSSLSKTPLTLSPKDKRRTLALVSKALNIGILWVPKKDSIKAPVKFAATDSAPYIILTETSRIGFAAITGTKQGNEQRVQQFSAQDIDTFIKRYSDFQSMMPFLRFAEKNQVSYIPNENRGRRSQSWGPKKTSPDNVDVVSSE
jgi:hypothetical protein